MVVPDGVFASASVAREPNTVRYRRAPWLIPLLR
jgi:hypothetical protein